MIKTTPVQNKALVSKRSSDAEGRAGPAAKDGPSASAAGVRSARNCSAGAKLNPIDRTSSTMAESSPVIERGRHGNEIKRLIASDTQLFPWNWRKHVKPQLQSARANRSIGVS
jgi:hypothetical protein